MYCTAWLVMLLAAAFVNQDTLRPQRESADYRCQVCKNCRSVSACFCLRSRPVCLTSTLRGRSGNVPSTTEILCQCIPLYRPTENCVEVSNLATGSSKNVCDTEKTEILISLQHNGSNLVVLDRWRWDWFTEIVQLPPFTVPEPRKSDGLLCYACYSTESFEDCDENAVEANCTVTGINDACSKYSMLAENDRGTKTRFFAKACTQEKFCSNPDFHCCKVDFCNAGKMQTKLSSGLVLGAWAIVHLVLNGFLI